MRQKLSHSLRWKCHWAKKYSASSWSGHKWFLTSLGTGLGNGHGWSTFFFPPARYLLQSGDFFQLDKSHGCGSLGKWMRVGWVGRGGKQPHLSCLIYSLTWCVHRAGRELLKAAVDIAGSELQQQHDETKTWLRECHRSLSSFCLHTAASQLPCQVRQCSSVA